MNACAGPAERLRRAAAPGCNVIVPLASEIAGLCDSGSSGSFGHLAPPPRACRRQRQSLSSQLQASRRRPSTTKRRQDPYSDGRSASAKPASRTRPWRARSSAARCSRPSPSLYQCPSSTVRRETTHKPASQSIRRPGLRPVGSRPPERRSYETRERNPRSLRGAHPQSGSRTRRSRRVKAGTGARLLVIAMVLVLALGLGFYFVIFQKSGADIQLASGPAFRRPGADRHCVSAESTEEPGPSRFQRKRRHGTKRRLRPRQRLCREAARRHRDHVKAGQSLAAIDTPELDAELRRKSEAERGYRPGRGEAGASRFRRDHVTASRNLPRGWFRPRARSQVRGEGRSDRRTQRGARAGRAPASRCASADRPDPV